MTHLVYRSTGTVAQSQLSSAEFDLINRVVRFSWHLGEHALPMCCRPDSLATLLLESAHSNSMEANIQCTAGYMCGKGDRVSVLHGNRCRLPASCDHDHTQTMSPLSSPRPFFPEAWLRSPNYILRSRLPPEPFIT